MQVTRTTGPTFESTDTTVIGTKPGPIKTSTTGTRVIEDIDAGLLRQRRNLLAISLGLLAFELGDGSVERASVMFGTLTLQKPGVIVFFAWAALAYAVWRYWLYSEPGATAFRDAVDQELALSPAYANLVQQVAKAEAERTAVDNLRPVILRQLFRRRLDFARSIPIEEIVGSNTRKHEESTFDPGLVVPVPYWKVAAIEWRAGLRAVVKNRAFSDYYLPYLVAFVTAVIGVFRYALH